MGDRARILWVRWLPWLLLFVWVCGNLVVAASRGGAWAPWDLFLVFTYMAAVLAYAVFALASPNWKRWATIVVLFTSWWVVPLGAKVLHSDLLERTRRNGTAIAKAVVRHEKRTGRYPDTLSVLVDTEFPAGIPEPWLLGETWNYRVMNSRFEVLVWTGDRHALCIGPELAWSSLGGG